LLALGALALLLAAGCGQELDTSYGRLRGKSINGTGVFAAMLRDQGHEVRSAIRLTESLEEWADVIVRFAPYPGPPAEDEADWYLNWSSNRPGRSLIYVPADYQADLDYWSAVLEHLPATAEPDMRTRVERLKTQETSALPKSRTRPKEVADAVDWFAVETSNDPPRVCKALEGPWAEDVDATHAAIRRHEVLKVESETVLLKGDGAPLVIEWSRYNDGQFLVVSNGSFLLNAALLNTSRRPLAERVVDWVGEPARRVAFVEGGFVLGGDVAPPSVFAMLRVPPFGWVVGQLVVLGLAACLARAPRLGRPRPEPPSGEDRPAAHAEALGELMARSKQADDARAILESYRRWRSPSRLARGEAPAPTEDRSIKLPKPSPIDNE
jgi:hypothetical protein